MSRRRVLVTRALDQRMKAGKKLEEARADILASKRHVKPLTVNGRRREAGFHHVVLTSPKS